MDPESATAIAGALCANTCLTRLDMDRDRVGVEGAKAVGSMLSNNSTLLCLCERMRVCPFPLQATVRYTRVCVT